jgi:uncharacterized protein
MKHALAIFAKTPLPGLVKTRLTPPLSAEESADLYRCMLLDTIARVSTLPYDTFLFYHGDERYFRGIASAAELIAQQGDDLGARLAQAFALLDSRGYRACSVIGTDAPDLPLSYIEESFRSLDAGSDVVFGPAEDGGYYLVGVSGRHAELFHDIPWSSDKVLATSLERARASRLAAALLPSWYDVDCIDDLRRPGLSDPSSEAPLTRHFIRDLHIAQIKAAYAWD